VGRAIRQQTHLVNRRDRKQASAVGFYRLVAGIAELLASADAVLAATGERVRACPPYGTLRRAAA
jgi:hypothetical protein